MRTARVTLIGAAGVQVVGLMLSGCGGDARVELTAADALSDVAGQMAGTLDEYHTEVSHFDASRESSVVAAFVGRVKKDASDEAALASHVSDFEAALHKIHTDQEAEWMRRSAAMDNVSLLRELSKGLQKLAIQSLSIEDEMKRYLQNWVALRQRGPMTANESNAGTSGAR